MQRFGYELAIPNDCVAANDQTYPQDALVFMERVLKADIKRSTELEITPIET